MDIFTVENLHGEEWRDIPDFGLYQISNKGRVKRVPHEKFYLKDKSVRFYPEKLMKRQLSNGYYLVTLVGEKRTKGTKSEPTCR